MTWTTVFKDGFEGEEHDQNADELTLPLRYSVYWMEDPEFESRLNRPEMDLKRVANGQPEVLRGKKAAGGFFTHCTGRLYFVSHLIPVQRNKPTRAQLYHMHVIQGGHGGARLGIVNGMGDFSGDFERVQGIDPDPQHDPAIAWGSWVSTYPDDAGYLANRAWRIIKTPEIYPTEAAVRVVVHFQANDPAQHAGGHWDELTVCQDITGEPPPPPGVDYDYIRQIVRDEIREALKALTISFDL